MSRRVLTFLAVVTAVAILIQPENTPAEKPDMSLRVGFGAAEITPKVGGDRSVFIAGFGHNRKATGVHDPIMARAVVFQHGSQKVAIVSLDLIGFFLPSVERVRKELPGYTYVLLTSTHSHEGPDTVGLWGPTPLQSGVDPDYVRFVENQVVAGVKAAAAALKPVTTRIGSVKAPELLHDAREPYVKHDELVVLEMRDGDRTTGLVVQWNCHPETLGSKNTLLSADYVGYTVKHLQEKYHCPVVYLTGTVGGLMTSLNVEVKDASGKALADGTYEKTHRYGVLLGAAAERALKTAQPITLTPLEVRSRSLFLPIANKLYVAARQFGVFERAAFIWTGDPNKAEPAPKNAGVDTRLCLRTELAYLRLGELDVAAIPGEIYPELVLSKVQNPADPGADFPDAPIEPGIYAALRGPHRMVVGLANDEIGYIIPKRQWDEKAPFCYGRTTAQYGEMNSLGPDTAPLVCAAFKQLAARK